MKIIEDYEKNRLFFRQRKMLVEEVKEWCVQYNIPLEPFYIVTALAALGYIDTKEVRKTYHRKYDSTLDESTLLIEKGIEKQLDKRAKNYKKAFSS